MKKKKLIYKFCYIHLRTTKTNIYLTLTDLNGNVILKLSSGMLKNKLNVKNMKKTTAATGNLLFEELKQRMNEKNIIVHFFIVKIEGMFMTGPAKSIIRSFQQYDDKIIFIDVRHRVAHNGTRLRKAPRK